MIEGEERVMRRYILVLVLSLLWSGCGGTRMSSSGVKRYETGSEKRYEVSCMEGGEEVEYEWVRVREGSLAYDVEKRVWDFVGKRKRDGRVLRVISSSCRMEMGDLI